jgi:hypothetical protein
MSLFVKTGGKTTASLASWKARWVPADRIYPRNPRWHSANIPGIPPGGPAPKAAANQVEEDFVHFKKSAIVFLFVALASVSAFAQQTGSISGAVRDSSGAGLPGVTVEARSTVLPQARVTTTENDGDYSLPELPPGDYSVTFSLSGMGTQTRNVRVLLDQNSTVNTTLGLESLSETITVTAESTLVDTTTAEINTTVSDDVFQQIPVGNDYRDLLRLAPGVQVNAEETTRGPASGGSQQDNVYQFDGVNIGMPQYGILNTEPSTHDIDQVSYNKGGAKAVDFVRAAGFTIDSVSKSGTSEFAGEVTYRFQPASATADVTPQNAKRYDQDRTWAILGIGGPILRERLFFYGSYFRPTLDQEGVSNLYGPVPDFTRERDEFFGKLTFTPTGNTLINGSYRSAEEVEEGAGIGQSESATNETREEATFKIGIVEGSWLMGSRGYLTFKFNDYANENLGVPAFPAGVQASITAGSHLDVNNLDQMGQFFVPSPLSNPTTDAQRNFNAFIPFLIERYGYLQNGTRVGGGTVGFESDINPQDFFRQSAQIGYDFTFGDTVSHDFHIGYQTFLEEEDLGRISNGWGDITVIGGRESFNNTPVAYLATFIRGTLGEFPVTSVHSEYESQNIEINDTVQWNNWAVSGGVLLSRDILYGQGLRDDSSTLSGYALSLGSMYKMYEIDWDKQIQPRLGATWAYNTQDTVYASYARYNPSVSSLPRAAAWDRNTVALLIDARFDAEGNLIGSSPRGSSAGKLFVEDMDPRYTDEFLIGTAQQLGPRLAGRAYARYRYSTNFWEDTQNNARIAFLPPEGVPRELYIPDLVERLAQIGTGGSNSAYVIAELDGAYTKYYEATIETDWRATDLMFVKGAYTWSHYYGTFDQDNAAGITDSTTFVGSSLIADGAGRQMWDLKYGDLRMDRRNLLKLFGYYTLPWNASAGAYGVYQSGHHWEAWDYRPYSALTTSTNPSYRYAEPGGSRETDAHYQVDLNYTQSFPIAGYSLQLEVDAFNVTDNQTGYDPEPNLNDPRFGIPRLFHAPRRFQVAARFQF